MPNPTPVPAAALAYGTAATSTTTAFTFGSLTSGSVAALASLTPLALASYFIQIITGTGVTAGFYGISGQLQTAGAASIVSGGTGYTNGSIVTVLGGTGTPATYTVTSSSGVVTSLALATAGNYSVLPANPVMFTGGNGQNLLANLTFTLTGANLQTSPGASGTAVTWNLIQAYPTAPQAMANVMVDNNGYFLGQTGGLTMYAGSVNMTGSAMRLVTSSTPCKFVIISPAAHNLSIGNAASQPLLYLSTAPMFVTIPVSDVAQIYVSGTASDLVGFCWFN